MKPTVSILTTLYNHEKFIVDALNSALGQTLLPDEIVVIDDASSDNSVIVAKSVLSERIRVYAETANLGGPNTMKGLNLCTGDYVAILNSDDCWEPDKIRQQIEYMESHPDCGVTFTHVTLIDEHSQPWPKGSNRLERVFNTHNRSRYKWLNYFFHYGNTLCASSAVIRRSCLTGLGGLDGRYIQLQDFDLWVRIAIAGYSVHVIEQPLTLYRQSRVGQNMSAGSHQARAIHSIEFARVLRQFWNIPTLADLKNIIPEIELASQSDASMISYYLAHYSKSIDTPHHRLFSTECMQHWGGNISSAELAFLCHGFSHIDYREFISNNLLRHQLETGFRGRLQGIADKILSYSSQQKIKSVLGRLLVK